MVKGTCSLSAHRAQGQNMVLVGSDPETYSNEGFIQSQSASEKLHMTINWAARLARRPNYRSTEPNNKS